MINFFRKIRKKLADDNQFFKYTRYAIGEILLVVIGILIALQINNWNGKRQEDEKIKFQLANLLRDMKGDRSGLLGVRSFHAFRVHTSIYLLNQNGITENIITFPEAGPIPKLASDGLYGGPIPDSSDKAFIIRGFSWLLRNNYRKPFRDALDEFKNTGLYAEFENQEIKKELRYYYFVYNFSFPPEDMGESSPTTLLKNSLLSEGYSYTDVYLLEDPLEILLSNPTNVALLKTIIDESTYRSNQANLLVEILDSLILKIENEIENYSKN